MTFEKQGTKFPEHFAQGFSEKDEIILNLRKCFQEIQNNLSRKLTELEP